MQASCRDILRSQVLRRTEIEILVSAMPRSRDSHRMYGRSAMVICPDPEEDRNR